MLGIISAVGDTLCQVFIEKKSPEEHSFKRTLRQSAVSCLYGAPLGHTWFGSVLPKLVAPFTQKPSRVIASVILDNTLLAAFSISTGVFLLELLKTHSVETSVYNVQNKFTTIFKNSMKYWCVVSTINHTFVPVHLKVLVGNISGIAWQIYMSYMVNAEHEYTPIPEDEQKLLATKLTPSL